MRPTSSNTGVRAGLGRKLAAWLGVLLAGCAAVDGGLTWPDETPDADCSGYACLVPRCASGATTELQGRVTAPNGHTPIPQALVYVPKERGPLSAQPSALTCEACSSPLRDRALVVTQTGMDGRFVLRNLPAGERIPIVVQKGRFRRVFELPLTACQSQQAMGPGLLGSLPLPAQRSEGDLPQMAVAAGDHDAIECVLRELGFSASEFTAARDPASAGEGRGAIHLYDNQSPGTPALPGQSPIAELLSDRERLFRYHQIFLNCSGTTHSAALLRQPQVLANLRDYLAAGGRVYVTDWSYDFLQQVPELSPFVCFEDDQDCSITTPHGFHTAVGQGGTLSSLRAAVNLNSPRTVALADWLRTLSETAPLVPEALPIRELLPGWVVVQQAAADSARYPVTTWLSADVADRIRPPRQRPLTLSFDYPPQAVCGRALFSSYHTRQRSMRLAFPAYCPPDGAALLPQEHVLAFLFFELTSCIGEIG
ncbi:MAG: hypothetical protein JNJ46_08480 [Myxococcales bacterium]|nr:hypothetical protein [Myxococcales bacterium]